MTIEKMKTCSFNTASFDDWQEKAAASLKGKPLDTLYTNTYENITLKPLYTKDDFPEGMVGDFPGVPDYRRGIHPMGYQSDSWQIANRVTYCNLEELKEKMDSALSKGQTAISFEVKPEIFADQKSLIAFFSSFKNGYPFCINAGSLQAPLLAALVIANQETGKADKLSGFIAADPVAEASLNGGIPKEETEFFQEWSRMLEEASTELPSLKTVMVNAAPYHNSGANAVQELAAAIATGVFLLQKLIENGWELKKALSKMVFNFAIGSNFFMETSKLRAARLLWNKTAEAFGAGMEDRKLVISAETSIFTKTISDPYVNMLRTGNEAFAAVLGGVQYLHTGTFDEAAGNTNEFSERVARNTQLILKSEAHLEKAADPAGGSFYVESLTKLLAEKAWELFLEIDSKGGVYETLKSGWLQEQIAKTAGKREIDILKRKKSIIGTNVYANLAEKITEPDNHENSKNYISGSLVDIMQKIKSDEAISSSFIEISSNFPPLEMKRLAEPFENLRFKADRIEKEGSVRPSVGLICLGELKKHKARADFISGFLAAGGIHAERSSEITNAADAADFIKSSNIGQFVICGENGDYSTMGPEFASELKQQHPEIELYLAGLPDEEEAEWKAAGIEEFIHIRSDAYQILSSLLQHMEVSADAKA
ncbi:methylmalonyl-CoA mutase subunit beta [Mesobacillus subterraneus]|uniref:methylmalonyl-CoA mutase family protein n=1 Tax=Mesobacillus subterraneus TaxID=285983 RepID=UPI00203D4F99|nr:methylmalonyl-CoA mutase family protein [Mesobacillus subterraneus]MCM3665420.1 methylmalonyl-CoA mutase subunit beta [Mesobacillus subterraneus]MCM3684573.1 methylmalonyl-CoA mutase subunit beta [Mesobacillus subterraneus]